MQNQTSHPSQTTAAMASFDRAGKLLQSLAEQKNAAARSSERRANRTVGEKIDIAKHAIAHGASNASKKFNITENQIYKYLREYRAGKFDNLPPDAQRAYATKNSGVSSEIMDLRNQVQALTQVNNRLMDAIERLMSGRAR